MATNTKIEWCDATWNCIRGCSVISPGCHSCYAMKQGHRFSGPGGAYEGLTKQTKAGPQWTGKVILAENHLLDPLKWREPKRVFVNSMSDLFHESVPDEWIDRIFAVMALAPQHTFQILTKRSDRMLAYCKTLGRHHEVDRVSLAAKALRPEGAGFFWSLGSPGWHLPNVWLGVSVENQKYADERIPHLLETPAAIRFISAEPLLGPIDFTLRGSRIPDWDEDWRYNVLSGEEWAGPRDDKPERSQHLDWVIVGGESGPGARPFDIAWARSIVQQCAEADVACFVKQLGKWPSSLTPVEGWQRLFDKDDVRYTKPTAWAPYSGGSGKGGDITEWPADLRVRQWPEVVSR